MKTRPGVSCVQSGCVFLSCAEGTYMSHGGHTGWTKDVDTVYLICVSGYLDGWLVVAVLDKTQT